MFTIGIVVFLTLGYVVLAVGVLNPFSGRSV